MNHRLTMLMSMLALGVCTSAVCAQDWPDNDEVYARMSNMVAAYPDLCEIYNLGTSVQGRTLWALRITDNLHLEEDEPEFRYISTMHGDEVTGIELTLRFAEMLLAGYGSNPDYTYYINEIDIWIMPLMNPDGNAMGQRYNANGYDLNRSFPDPFTAPENTPVGKQPEIAVVMNWSFAESFVLSANYHGGALLVNYPYDNNATGSSVYTACPDDDVFIDISLAYTVTNIPMYNGDFSQGITNGADWYAIDGGMQDWNYRYMGCNEVTIEVSNSKTPPWSQADTFWNDNRESMVAYMEKCLIGIRGIVTDASSGLPVDATIIIEGRETENVYTDPDVGDYHRMLLPGTYTMTVEADGYDPITIEDIVVNAGDATELDIVLSPPPAIISPNGGEVLDTNAPTTITWDGNPISQFHLQATTNFGEIGDEADDFESGVFDPLYTTGGHQDWLIDDTAANAHNGTYAARAGDIDDGTAGNPQTSYLTRNATGGTVSFWHHVSSEVNYDFFNFYIDDVRILHVSGPNNDWEFFQTTLSDAPHVLKWEYYKDSSVTDGDDTVWIDDLQITSDLTVWTDIVALTDAGATAHDWTPTEAGEFCKVRVRSYTNSIWGPFDESDDTFEIVGGVPCPWDFAPAGGDGSVGLGDLNALLSNWGDCPAGDCPWDLAPAGGDGSVGLGDLNALLSNWGVCP